MSARRHANTCGLVGHVFDETVGELEVWDDDQGVPLSVRNRVDLHPISSMVPSYPANLDAISDLEGLKNVTKTVMPPKMLDTKSLAAMAMAKPPMPTPASRAPTS